MTGLFIHLFVWVLPGYPPEIQQGLIDKLQLGNVSTDPTHAVIQGEVAVLPAADTG